MLRGHSRHYLAFIVGLSSGYILCWLLMLCPSNEKTSPEMDFLRHQIQKLESANAAPICGMVAQSWQSVKNLIADKSVKVNICADFQSALFSVTFHMNINEQK